jgi:hypothetical protein
MRRQIASLAERALPRSIAGRFAVCWATFLLASLVVGALLLSLYRQSTTEMGAALSNSAAGLIVDRAGFNAAFLFLAGAAALAFLLFWLAVPETSRRS